MSDTETGSAPAPAPAPAGGGVQPLPEGTPPGGFNIGEALRGANLSKDLLLPVGILGILVLLLVPLPTPVLDFALSISITFSVVILLTVVLIKSPLELTSFPTILLIATMLRLGLNVASTRLILSEGHTGTDAAGRVIEAFGSFVAGGNYVIGIIVFSILVIINFIVITKGAGRIAEVAARFTLDAMPGKQMAIDADLSSGLINEDDARKRRKELETESSFYGAMDGASKFVRGDAIAGILITFINIIGGIIIGVVQQDMSMAEAAENYTLLTIGDGLVSQIPALVVSTGAGMLVTKAGVTGATDAAVFGQLTNYRMTLWIAAGLLVLMSFIPGLPAWPFALLAIVCATSAYFLQRQDKQDGSRRPDRRDGGRSSGRAAGRADLDRAADRPDPAGTGLRPAAADQRQ